MRYLICGLVLAGALVAQDVAAQSTAAQTQEILATVRLSQPVFADGKPLAVGTYQVRLTQDRPSPLAGQTAEAQQWVEFVADGKVVGREIAEVLRDSDPSPVGTSSIPARKGSRVELLKGGEFVRVSATRGGERYLIYLPTSQ